MTMTRDEAIAFLMDWNSRYNGGDAPNPPSERDGILFWCVGQNSTHEFHAGVGPDGRLYSYTIGQIPMDVEDPAEDATDEEWAEFHRAYEASWEETTREVENFNGYYGHF